MPSQHKQPSACAPLPIVEPPTCQLNRSCASPTFPAAQPQVRSLLEHGQRPYVLARMLGSNRSVVYWLTPKAAHLKILRLMRKPPFVISGVASQRSALGEASHMLEGACRGAECRDPELISFLRQQPPPLEFTFMREPIGYLISAAAQALRLIVNYDCVDRADRPWAWRAPDSAADVVRVLQFALTDDLWATGGLGANRSNMIGIGRNARRQEIYRKQCNNKEVANARVVLRSAVRHVFPQTAGYGWDPEQGVKRLHFVGRTEAFAADWRRLLQQLGHDSKAVSVAQHV